MLSRVAENIYWLARYIERAENTARLINVNTNLLLDLPKKAQLGWEPIVEIMGSREEYCKSHDDFEERTVLRYIIADTANPASIISSLRMARENARTIRDIIPREAWEQVNDLFLDVKSSAPSGVARRHRYEFLLNVIQGAQTITGMLAGTMLHDQGYEFLRMGRNLERADMTTRIIDVRSASLLEEQPGGLAPYETIQWVSVLKSLTAYQMYRRAIQVRVRRPDVLKFLLQERRFPRAFYHTVCEVEVCLKALPRYETPVAACNKLQEQVLKAKPDKLQQEELHKFIDKLQLGLGKLNDSITDTYFRYDGKK